MDPRTHAEQPYRRWLPQAIRSVLDRQEPGSVTWTAEGLAQRGLFDSEPPTMPLPELALSKAFCVRAKRIACHRSVRRWDILYRLLYRIHAEGDRHLLERAGDSDVRRFETFDRAVTIDVHRMKAFLRFQEPKEKTGDGYLVAHYEPDHRILGWVAPHFIRRLGDTSWAILTPDASVTYDRGRCHFGPGVRLLSSEDPDDIAALWCGYYRTTFNRERANPTLLDKNLPQRYRKHLTEAPTIEQLRMPFAD